MRLLLACAHQRGLRSGTSIAREELASASESEVASRGRVPVARGNLTLKEEVQYT